MTAPTLELNLRATGVEDVKNLNEALGLLETHVKSLGQLKGKLSALDQIKKELSGLRTDLQEGLAVLTSVMSNGTVKIFSEAEKVTKVAGRRHKKAMAEAMLEAANAVSAGNQAIQRRLTESGAALGAAAEAQGAKVGKGFAQGAQAEISKVRLSLPAINFGQGATGKVAVNGLGGLADAEKMVEQYRKLPRALAAYNQELKLNMDYLTAVYRKGQAEQLSSQISFEAKQKQLWMGHQQALASRLKSESSMMDQAVRAYRAHQAQMLAISAQHQTGVATANASGAYSSLSTFKTVVPKDLVPDTSGSVSKLNKLGQSLGLFTKHAGDAHSAARGLASGFGLLWLTWGNMVPLLAGAAVSNAFVQMVKMGAEVQHTFSVIKELSEESAEAVSGLNLQMLELARSGPLGPQEIAEAMKTLALAGLEAGEVSTAIKDVINFSVAGTVSLKDAADVMTTVATAFGISAEGYNYVGDVIAKTAAVSKSSVESIGNAFKTASVINSQYGASLEDVGIGLALLANMGIQGTAAGTALRNMYVDLLGRTPKVTAALKELGVNAIDPLTGKAKSLVDIFTQMTTKLGDFDPTKQTKLLQDIFSERGGKGSEAIRQAFLRPIDALGRELPSKFELLKKEIDSAAGFMANAAANLALTPLNQMKSVVATLQATLVESFSEMQPYVLSISAELKKALSSEEFKAALQSIGRLVAEVTSLLIRHLDVLVLLGTAYVGLKVVGALTTMYSAFQARVLLASEALLSQAAAANLAAAANGKLAVASAASSAGTAAGAAAAATGLARIPGMIGMALNVFSKFVPWVTAAWVAWEAYNFWTLKSATSSGNVEDASISLAKALQTEAERLREINEAKMMGLSLDELRTRRGAARAVAETQGPVDLAQSALSAAEKAAKDSRPLVAADAARRIPALQKEVEWQKLLQAESIKSVKMAQAAVTAEAELGKELQKAAEQARLNSQPKGTKGLSGGDAGRGYSKGVAADTDLRAVEDALRTRESIVKTAYDNERQLTEARHKAGTVSEAEYQTEILRSTRKYESDRLSLIVQAQTAYNAEYDKQVASVKKTMSGEAQTAALDNLGNAYRKFMESTNAALENVGSDASKRNQLSVIELEGSVVKLTKTTDEYWAKAEAGLKKEVAVAAAREASAGMSEEARARMEAEANEVGKHAGKMAELEQGYLDAATQMLAFDAAMQANNDTSETSQAKFKAMQALVLKFAEALQLSADQVKRLTSMSSDAAAANASAAMQNKLVKDTQEMGKTISGKLADAILDGGKDGGKALKDWIKSYFIREPIKVLLQGVLQPMGNMVAQVLSGGGGTGASGGLGSLSSLGSFGGALGAFGTGASYGATSLFANGLGATLSAGSSMMGAGSIAAGLGTIVGALGPIALGVAAIHSLTSGKGGPKTEGGFGYGVENRGDGTAAKAITDTITTGYGQLATLLGGKVGSLDVGAFFAMDNAKKGDALTQLQIAGTLNGQEVYNRAARGLGGNNNIENVARGEEALQAAIAEDSSRFILAALQATEGLAEGMRTIIDATDAYNSSLEEVNATLARAQVAGQQRLDLEERLFQATATDAEKLARTREKELQAIDPTNSALLRQVYAQEDLKVATERMNAVTQEREGLERQLLQLQGNTLELRRRELLELDPSNQAIQQQIWMLQDQQEAYQLAQQAAQEAMQAQNAYVQAMASAGDSIRSFLAELTRTEGGLASPEDLLANSKSQYLTDLALAQAGDADASARIAASAQAYIDAQKAYTASGGDTSAVIAQIIAELGALPATQTFESQMLTSLGTIATNTGSTGSIVTAVGGIGAAVATPVNTAVAGIIASLPGAFADIDLNADGLVTYDELKRFMEGKATSTDIGNVVSAVDLNQDGFIDVIEANKAAMLAVVTAFATEIKSSFGDIDVDLSGGITLEELKTFMSGKATDTEIGRLFGILDTDQNKLVTASEAAKGSLGELTATDLGGAVVRGDILNLYTGLHLDLGTISLQLAGILSNTTQTVTLLGAVPWFVGAPTLDPGAVPPWNLYAQGGAFTNGIVSRPTLFDASLMGEDTSEAILPLTNIGGSLGVRSVGPDGNKANEQLRLELAGLREQLEVLTDVVAEGARRQVAVQTQIVQNTGEIANEVEFSKARY